MGWWGHYLGYTPKGQERIKYVIEEEGYDAEDERHIWKPLATALVGSTVYLAVERTEKATGKKVVYAEVCLTRMDRGYMMVKAMSDTMGPGYYDCPKRILDLLTPTDSEWANEWRRMCAEHRGKSRADALTKCEIGTLVKRKDNGVVLEAYRHRKRKVFVDWATHKYNTASQLRKIGYEIINQK